MERMQANMTKKNKTRFQCTPKKTRTMPYLANHRPCHDFVHAKCRVEFTKYCTCHQKCISEYKRSHEMWQIRFIALTTPNIHAAKVQDLKMHGFCETSSKMQGQDLNKDADPTMTREWRRHAATCSFAEVKYLTVETHFAWESTTSFRAPAIYPDFTKCCACHEKWHSNITKNCACHMKSHSNISQDFKKHEVCETSSKLTAQDLSYSYSQLLYCQLLLLSATWLSCQWAKVRISEVFQLNFLRSLHAKQ